jgi:hypothetical protein
MGVHASDIKEEYEEFKEFEEFEEPWRRAALERVPHNLPHWFYHLPRLETVKSRRLPGTTQRDALRLNSPRGL